MDYLRLDEVLLTDIDFWVYSAIFPNEDDMIAMALLQYASYTLRNHVAACGSSSTFVPNEFMRISVIQAVAGCARARAILRRNRARWAAFLN